MIRTWIRRLFLGGLAIGLLLVVVVAAWSGYDNRRLPSRSVPADRLSAADKATVAEALRLHRAVADSIWPGWGVHEPAIVLYDESHAFLVGLRDPEPGWIRTPGHRVRGGPWEPVPGDSIEGRPYFRQRLPKEGDPQAFTVRVGGCWAASLPTPTWFRISLAEQVRRSMPAPLATVFPIRLAVGALLGGTEGYVTKAEHEVFHAWQGEMGAGRLEQAERAVSTCEARYPDDREFRRSWKRELGALDNALRATESEMCRRYVRRFLRARAERRSGSRLAPALVDYERRREWLEGLAKYAELQSWGRAAQGGPEWGPALGRDPDFHGYAGFQQLWGRELLALRVNQGDVLFYSTGMAQAVLLDRLAPGWKSEALPGNGALEDLLAGATAVRSPTGASAGTSAPPRAD